MKNIGALSSILKNAANSIKKEIGVSFGYHDPDTWVSTGSYALNYRISGRFDRGIPLGKVVMFAGESGAGKSFVVSGNIIREAQKLDIHVVLIDTENALDEKWLNDCGVDTSPEALTKINLGMIGHMAKYVYEFCNNYRDAYGSLPSEERPKVMFVVDSIGMLNTEVALEQQRKGELKGDMGHKPKQLKAFITSCVNTLGALNIGMALVNHTYDSQDMFNPDPKISGGSGSVYASSIVIAMQKLKLKEDAEGNKASGVTGIRAKCKVMKTRFNKPFEEVELKIPYVSGMNPYTGLFEMFESMGFFKSSGNSFVYVDIETGEEIKKFRKGWTLNDDNCLDRIMKQFYDHPIIKAIDKSEYGSEDFGVDVESTADEEIEE